MPKAQLLSNWFKSAGFKALFVVLVMLFNVTLSTLSNTSVFAAETAGDTTEQTEIEEDTQEADEQEATESENQESSDDTSDDVTEEEDAIEEDTELPVSTGENKDEASEITAAVIEAPALEDDEIIAEQTVYEVIESHPELSMVGEILESGYCYELYYLHTSEMPLTFFLPTNSAIENIVATPGTNGEEFNQLKGNFDEICALIASHTTHITEDIEIEGAITSADVAPGDSLYALAYGNDIDGILIENIAGTLYVDGNMTTEQDILVAEGVVHIVNSVLLPQSVGTIDEVITDKTSPELNGKIIPYQYLEIADGEYDEGYPDMRELCVVVRIDGIPYMANVDGYTWQIEADRVTLNPTKTDTLFDIIVREVKNAQDQVTVDSVEVDTPEPTCEALKTDIEQAEFTINDFKEVMTRGGQLVGVTMSRSVLSFLEPVVEEEEEGEVLGETTDEPVIEKVSTKTETSVASYSCGKGVCGDEFAQAGDPSTTDTDGDGVVDSEDPDPLDPEVTGLEDGSDDDSENNETTADDEEDDEDTNVALWFLAGGGVVGAWYLLWQRSGREL